MKKKKKKKKKNNQARYEIGFLPVNIALNIAPTSLATVPPDETGEVTYSHTFKAVGVIKINIFS